MSAFVKNLQNRGIPAYELSAAPCEEVMVVGEGLEDPFLRRVIQELRDRFLGDLVFDAVDEGIYSGWMGWADVVVDEGEPDPMIREVVKMYPLFQNSLDSGFVLPDEVTWEDIVGSCAFRVIAGIPDFERFPGSLFTDAPVEQNSIVRVAGVTTDDQGDRLFIWCEPLSGEFEGSFLP